MTTTRRTLASLTIAAGLLLGLGGTAHAHVPTGPDGQPCSDWTNPDGTHGTNCPSTGGGGGGGGHYRGGWDLKAAKKV